MKKSKKIVVMALAAFCLLGAFGYTGGISTYNEKLPIYFY